MQNIADRQELEAENRAYQTNLESLVTARTQQLQAAMQNLERSYEITLQASTLPPWPLRPSGV
jgi:hypothetical protein